MPEIMPEAAPIDIIRVWEINLVGRTGAILTDDVEDALQMVTEFIRARPTGVHDTLLVRRYTMARKDYERLEESC